MKWDLFISHASEDKEEVVLPLAKALQSAGLRVWLDQQQLEVGDSLRAKIDAGLAASRFGVVVLSKAFFRKHWPEKELDGLAAKERRKHKVILPVWHKVDQRLVAKFSPTLAGVLALDTSAGIGSIAMKITKVVLAPGSGSPSAKKPNLARLFVDLLENSQSTGDIADFLKIHQQIIVRAFADSGAKVHGPIELGDSHIHLGISQLMTTTMRWRSHLIQLAAPGDEIICSDGSPTASVLGVVNLLHRARTWIGENESLAASKMNGLNQSFLGIIVAGRRSKLDAAASERLRAYNDGLIGISVRTYDHLVDTATIILQESIV